MEILLIHPPFGAVPSGGHRYNRALLDCAARRDLPFRSYPWAPGEPLPADVRDGSVWLWDSLFLRSLAENPPAGAVQGLLLHYLPFEDPTLDAAARKRAASSFDRAAERTAFFVATGAGIARWLEGRFAPKPVVLAEPGVEEAFIVAGWKAVSMDRGRGPIRLVTVANLLPAKGHGELLDALAAIRHWDWEWHWAGDLNADPVYAARFFERCRDAHLDCRVIWHGILEIDALAGLLAASDLFVSASRYESYGMAVAEAVAAGLPVLTTDVGEARRIVGNGMAGRVVPVGDPRRLELAMRELAGNRTLRIGLREGARNLAPRTWGLALADFWAGMEKAGVIAGL